MKSLSVINYQIVGRGFGKRDGNVESHPGEGCYRASCRHVALTLRQSHDPTLAGRGNRMGHLSKGTESSIGHEALSGPSLVRIPPPPLAEKVARPSAS